MILYMHLLYGNFLHSVESEKRKAANALPHARLNKKISLRKIL